ncbi:MAG: DUF1326 domain-containing protein [Planctomycetes bacterium]|nr:DUF1326 domain-containing protein [Planctomycetota bacterium]
MKVLLTLAFATSAALGMRYLCGDGCCTLTRPEADIEPAGTYIEARTASVFAGACHYNSELVTAGREALLAWRFEDGRVAGVALGGVELMAAVASSENLAQGAARRSVVYVDAAASREQREAALEWLKARHGSELGEIVAVEELSLDVSFDGELYTARAGDALALSGGLLPDRECCKMPYDVWYQPFTPIAGRIVGNSERFVWNETRLARAFENRERNDAFVGTFGPGAGGSCCVLPSRAAALGAQ